MKHPLSDFKYCPHCGNERFLPDSPTGSRCEHCGFTFFPNACAATAAIIVDQEGRLVCVRRAKDPAKGKLDLPGGFVDPGESITDGLIREVKEELGGDVVSYRFICSFPNVYPFSGHLVHTADSFFLCRLSDYEQLRAGDDAAALERIPLEEVRPEDFGFDSIQRGINFARKILIAEKR